MYYGVLRADHAGEGTCFITARTPSAVNQLERRSPLDEGADDRLKKATSRMGTTIMQKTGQVERTVDREFAEEEGRYRVYVEIPIPSSSPVSTFRLLSRRLRCERDFTDDQDGERSEQPAT